MMPPLVSRPRPSALTFAVLVAACTHGSPGAPPLDGSDPLPGADGPATEGDAPLIACEPGLGADFYTRVTPALDDLPPGTALFCDTYAAGTVAGYFGHRVTYVTTAVVAGVETKLTATGQVWVPMAPISADRPVVANTHGATGVVAACAPSVSGQFDRFIMTGPVATAIPGAVIVDADYVGLGRDPGLRTSDATFAITDPRFGDVVHPFAAMSHTYISIEGEGRATIDLVRAARQLEGTGIGARPRWLVAGVSQGGHAALATGEVWSRGYGADTELRGVVAGAPGSALEDSTNVTPAIAQALAPMVLGGLALEHPELRPSAFLSTPTLVGFARTGGGQGTVSQCMTSVQAVMNWLTVYAFYGSTIYKSDPAQDPTARAILIANSPGHARTHVPIFIGQVEGDPFVPPARTTKLVELERATNPEGVTACLYAQPGGVNPANHQAFQWMFGTGPATCTGPDGEATTVSAAGFIAQVFAP